MLETPQTELRDLMLALNPAMEISFEQAQQLVQLVRSATVDGQHTGCLHARATQPGERR